MTSYDLSGARSTRVTFTVLATGVMAFAVLQSLVTPVLSTIQRHMHTSQNTVTWVLTVYLLSASIFTPIFGRIGDKIGKRRVFVYALIGLVIGSLFAALATSIGVLIVARAIQGVGGGVLPLAFGIIRDEFPAEEVSGAVGMTAALTAVGGGLGIVLAGPIVETLGYHWLFWIPMIVVSIAAAAAHFLVPESPVRAKGPISVRGALLLSLWLAALLLAVSEGSQWGWASGRTLGLLAVAAVVGVIWFFVENRSAAPLIDMKMMRLPAVWTTNLVALLFGVGMYAAMAFVPEFVQTPRAATGYGFTASVTLSGLFMVPLTVGMFIFGAMTSRLSARFGARLVLLAGAFVSATGYALLAFAHHYAWEVYLATAVIGVSLGLAFSALSNLIVIAVPPEQTGVATGMNANIRTIGGSIGSAVAGTIITAGVLPGGFPHEAGYTHGFATLAAVSALATLAVLVVPKVSRDSVSVTDLPHAELAMVAAGTLRGAESE